MGHSPTGFDVYHVFLNDPVLVISNNIWSEQVNEPKLQSDRDWIEKNQVLVLVTGPMYVS